MTTSFSHSYAQQLPDLVSPVRPQALHEAKLIAVNTELADELGLPEWFTEEQKLLIELFDEKGSLSANAVAQKYGGHQFGHWNPDLGDGRGLLLAEVRNAQEQKIDLHLKGAGKTPYSRFGDGRAVLRSTIREYLISESLHALGIPTSRSLCLFSSAHPVQRETMETGAMMIRTCPSHIRFGHFEYFYHHKQYDKLTQLFDYCFEHHFTQARAYEDPYAAMFEEVVKTTAEMIAKWQVFGFCHGVMNTDNMSIHGVTFDYGPFAFLDNFVPDYICNHSDTGGRYAFDQQPGVALWNLQALAQPFLHFLDEEKVRAILGQYEPTLIANYQSLMAQKFGFEESSAEDAALVNGFLQQLAQEKRDYTQAFVVLSQVMQDQDNQAFYDFFIDQDWAAHWLAEYLERVGQQTQSCAERQATMNQINPRFIPRNHLLQDVIEQAESGDFGAFHEILEVLKTPYKVLPNSRKWYRPPSQDKVGIPLSCSS